ncbi:MAG: cheR36H [Betaproteobacteria bacterium]|nr:cheR36H [Betaproteobacteria bacterium]
MATIPHNPLFAPIPGAPPIVVPNEFNMSSRDFERICQLIRRRAGIALNSSKRTMVYSRLARRLRATGKGSFEEYLDWLEGAGGGAEWQDFVNALTTNLTSFFREAHHFPVLEEHLRKLRGRERINIWCCAASTGEEPYTIAISAMEAFASLDPPVRIIATDIDTSVLDTARAGAYRDDAVAKLPPEILRKYFLRGSGANAGYVRVRPEVAAMVTFRPLNLLDPQWSLRTGFDAIFCRNVMIYFDKETQFAILRRFAPLLGPGGLLFVGHSENFSQARDIFHLLGKTVYEVNPAVAAKQGPRRGDA